MLRTTTRPVPPFARGFGVHPHADVLLPEPEHDAIAMAPAGQLWTTVGDLARWAALLAGYRPDVLAPETAAEMREPIALSDLPGQAWTVAHGLGLELFNRGGTRSYGHNGSMPGFLAILRMEQQTDDGVIIMTNATSGLDASLEVDLIAILREHEERPVVAWKAAGGGAPAQLLELTGTWYWGTIEMAVSLTRDGRFDLRAVRFGPESFFVPAEDGTFVGQHGYFAGETLCVVRRDDKTLSHLEVGSFVLTRTPYDASASSPGGVDPGGWRGSPPGREPRHTLRSWRKDA
jgi:hypothetical protein